MGEALTILLSSLAGLALGAVTTVLILRARQQAALATLRAESEARAATEQQRAEAALARATELEARLRQLDEDLARTRSLHADAQARIAQLETTLQHERNSAREKLDELKDAHAKLTAEFKAISSDVLKHNNEAFLELAKATFARLHQQSTGELEKRQVAIDALVKPLKESLDKVTSKVSEIEEARHKAYGQLTEQLAQLNAAQVQLQAEAARLSTALRSTTYAGSWGELQLRRVVEMADMLPHVDFVEQTGGDGSLRADMVVHLPGGQNIVVDAKTPLQSYREGLDADDEATRAARMRDHAAKVRGHIDALGAKSYWKQYQPAPEFVVLFMPGDHFLTAALQADPTLLERAISRRVLLATPTSLIALLKAAAYGWRQEAVSRNAEEISTLGRQLHERLGTFANHLDRIGKGLESTLKSYNAAVGSFEQSVLPGARKFGELGARGTKELTDPRVVDTAPRSVTRRE